MKLQCENASCLCTGRREGEGRGRISSSALAHRAICTGCDYYVVRTRASCLAVRGVLAVSAHSLQCPIYGILGHSCASSSPSRATREPILLRFAL